MKKILSLLMLCALSWVAVAQTTLTKPQAMKALMGKEHLRNTIKALQQPEPQQATLADEPTWTQHDTTEVFFRSFHIDPYYTPWDTVVGRNGDTAIVGGDWYFVLKNDRYQFCFDFYGNPETMAGEYTEADLYSDPLMSWCIFPEADEKTHYYKTLKMTILEEKIGRYLTKYILDVVILVTRGLDGENGESKPEYGYFKIHAEHTMITTDSKYDVAILNCVVTPEEDRVRIAGKNDTMDVDLTFFTETGVEGYYSHKLMDTENAKLVHREVPYEIINLEGVIYSAPNKAGGVSYVFMYEALASSKTDTVFFNVAMEAPIVPVGTIDISCYNMVINDAFGMSHSSIEISASNSAYDVYAGYQDTKVTTPKEYTDGTSYVFLTDLRTGQKIESSLQCNLSITGDKLQGYKVEIKMLGSDYKQYNIHLVYEKPEAKETKVLDFKNNSKTMYYILDPYLPELQMANFDGEYSVSFDILYINQVMGGEFDMTNMLEEQTFLIHHINDNGDEYDSPVRFAEFGGKIWQENDTTFLTASILGFDSIQYEISMFYAVPAPTETVTYTFNGLGNDIVDLQNAVSQSGIFILDAMSADGQLMAKVNVERITTKSIEGTFYNDGKFDHTDFYPSDTWVKVYNATTKAYDEYSVLKGTMTVKQEGKIVTAVASFICDNAVQYDLTFITEYTREHIGFDSEEGDVDYTYAPESYYEIKEWVESDNRINLDIFAPDYSNITQLAFFADHVDPEIIIPEGTYPINSSMEPGTVYASPGVAVGGGPIRSFFCYTYPKEEDDDIYIYYYQDGLYCLVDGTVTVKKVNGKLSFDIDAYNSYDLSVKLQYNADGTAVENITTDPTNNVVKRLVNGQLLIIRNGKAYNATGALIK